MKTILLIEDNPDMRENTAEIMELAQYKVLTANNGKEGVKIAQRELPDLIICDIMMPELDGYGVLNILGKQSSTAGIPFIFLSAKAEKSDLRMGMSMGADDYLTKPFENTELIQAVEVRLKKSEQLRSIFTPSADGLTDFLREAGGIDSMAALANNKEKKSFRKKDALYTQGKQPRGVFFITKGKIKTRKSNEDGKEFVTGLYKEGDFIGYSSLLEEIPYADDAIAMEDSEAIIIPKEDFFALLNTNREVAATFIKMLSGNVAEMEDRLIRLAYNSVRKRVAEALLMLQDRYANEGENLNISLSRDDLAGIVGTAPETVTRTLSDFKDEGIVSVKASHIKILNAEKLAKMREIETPHDFRFPVIA